MTGSVTHWLAELRAGDRSAAEKLWERYFSALVRHARVILRSVPRRMADEEDVAISAFDSFYRAAEAGNFPRLTDRDDLWRLLLVVTERQAADEARRQSASKRGGGRVRGESTLAPSQHLSEIAGADPTPEFAVIVAEEMQRLLGVLGDERLRQIALFKLEGYTNREIAERVGASLATIERKLQMIRRLWCDQKPA
jgi:DNA-directed RNA polymerase specialized sigma24 family protein